MQFPHLQKVRVTVRLATEEDVPRVPEREEGEEEKKKKKKKKKKKEGPPC